MEQELEKAKKALDTLINKARVHLYKPIQIAEILCRDRVSKDINLNDLESYRTRSKKWRDIVCIQFIGRVSTSSAKYQDNLFERNAVPPDIIEILGRENRDKNGIVEAYIYKNLRKRLSQMTSGLAYVKKSDRNKFEIEEFLRLFRNEPGLKRSVDKIFEIIVFSLFSALVDELEISVEVSLNQGKKELLEEFKDFAKDVINIDPENTTFKIPAKVHRVGVTNASDRGLDMWANFGIVIQIKHLSLDERLAEGIVSSVNGDRIIIVCKEAQQNVIASLLTQMGWRARIQSIITEEMLFKWYEKALRGKFGRLIGDKVLKTLSEEIKNEFPSSDTKELDEFEYERGYKLLHDEYWQIE